MYQPHCGEKFPGRGPLEAVGAAATEALLPLLLLVVLTAMLGSMMVELGG